MATNHANVPEVEFWPKDGGACPSCGKPYTIGCLCWDTAHKVLSWEVGTFIDQNGNSILSTPYLHTRQDPKKAPLPYAKQVNACLNCGGEFIDARDFVRDLMAGGTLGHVHWPICPTKQSKLRVP